MSDLIYPFHYRREIICLSYNPYGAFAKLGDKSAGPVGQFTRFRAVPALANQKFGVVLPCEVVACSLKSVLKSYQDAVLQFEREEWNVRI